MEWNILIVNGPQCHQLLFVYIVWVRDVKWRGVMLFRLSSDFLENVLCAGMVRHVKRTVIGMS